MNTAELTLDYQCELNNDLKHLQFQSQNEGYMVTLVDLQGSEILRGYGDSPSDALNDLHSNLI